jgi:hypothetical protein
VVSLLLLETCGYEDSSVTPAVQPIVSRLPTASDGIRRKTAVVAGWVSLPRLDGLPRRKRTREFGAIGTPQMVRSCCSRDGIDGVPAA